MEITLDWVRARAFDFLPGGVKLCPVDRAQADEVAAILRRFATEIEVGHAPEGGPYPDVSTVFFRWLPLSERTCDHCGETPNMHMGTMMQCWERETRYERDPYLQD